MKKTLKLAKPKKVSVSKLKKKAWDIFSKYIRTKYSHDGVVICYTCGKVGTVKTMQAGHGIGGRNNAVLFFEEIVRPQCVGCNLYGRGKYSIFAEKLIKEYGVEKYSEFVFASNTVLPLKADNYVNIYEKYKKLLETL